MSAPDAAEKSAIRFQLITLRVLRSAIELTKCHLLRWAPAQGSAATSTVRANAKRAQAQGVAHFRHRIHVGKAVKRF